MSSTLAPPPLPPPSAPTSLWPGRTRVEVLVDPAGVALYDVTAGSFVGFNMTWGPGAPLQRVAYAERVEGTRPL